MTRGLPGSGKSSWAAEQAGCTVITKDDIRAELEAGGWKWSKEGEKHVLAIRDTRIIDAFRAGYCVISADTNLAPRHKARLMELAKQQKAQFIVKDFTHVPLEICIQRDSQRKEPVGKDVIMGMYNEFLKIDAEPYVPDTSKPIALICDLDGTLALHEGRRSIFDYSKCDKDAVNRVVFNIIHLFAKEGYTIVYMTGRDEWCRYQTEDFLASNGCPRGPLFMRPDADKRKDFVAKAEMFDKFVRKEYNVKFALDDRDQVVKMWRALGLTCLQVAEGSF